MHDGLTRSPAGHSSRVTRHWPLLLVLALAALLRGWAIDWGAPFVYHPDEHLVLNPALNIVRERDPNPHWFQYPSLLLYLEAGVVAVTQPFVRAPLSIDPVANRVGPWDALPAQWPFVLGGRLVVAGLAVLGIWLMYLAGARYASPAVGVTAALFLTAAPLHNESAHYLTTDVPATTLLTAALWFAVRALRGARRDDALAGLCAGLAAATKYTAGIALCLPLAVALAPGWRQSARRATTVLVAAAGGFIIACPFAVLDFAALWSGIVQQRQNYLGGKGSGNCGWYLDYLYRAGLGRPLALLCVVALVVSLIALLRRVARLASDEPIDWARWRLDLALALVPIGYFALLASYPSRAERNLILLLPFLCLLAADGCWRGVRALVPGRRGGVLFAVFVGAIAAPGLLAGARHDWLLTQPDTRTVALCWIETNVPPGSRIAREEYTPQVPAERYPVVYRWSLAFRPYGWYVAAGVDYLVVSASVYDRALHAPFVAGRAGPAFYTFLLQQVPLAAEIAPGPARPGPTIRIYRVPRAR